MKALKTLYLHDNRLTGKTMNMLEFEIDETWEIDFFLYIRQCLLRADSTTARGVTGIISSRFAHKPFDRSADVHGDVRNLFGEWS